MKISVITVTWNSGKTIEDTIKSVLQQRYTNIEHVIKDGGSKDDTLEICERYKKDFYSSADAPSPKVKTMLILSGKDKGIYDAMNQGVQVATGDIIGILNSDDFFTSDDVLERVAKEFEADPELEAIYGDIHFVSVDASFDQPGKCKRYYSSSYFRPWLLRFGFMPAHPSFYCKKAIFEKYGLYDLQYKTSADFEMMVRLFAKHHVKAKYLDMDFVTMRTGGESTAGLNSKRKVNSDISRSLKTHGIYSNQVMQAVRYVWRVFELIYTRIKY